MPPPLGGSSEGLPSRVEYLSPQGVLLPQVYGTIASPLWLELRGHAAGQVAPSWTVCRLTCHRLLPWLRVTFAMVLDAARPGSDQRPRSTAPATGPVSPLGWPSASDPGGVVGWCVVSCVRCPGPPGSFSPVCLPCMWCCVCGVSGLVAPVHWCACSVCRVACAVSSASWLLFTDVHALCVLACVRCPGPLGSCSPVCALVVWRCGCGVPGRVAPVHRCARSVRRVACAVFGATWLPFTGVLARCAVLRVRCSGPAGSRSPVCSLGVSCCGCGVPGHLAPVHRCARAVCWVCGVLGPPCGVACAVSRALWLLFTCVLARCVVVRVQCPGPLGSCFPACALVVWRCVCGGPGRVAPVHLCACSVCRGACAVSRASWLLFTGVRARCVALCVRWPGPCGSCSPVCLHCVWCCVCGVPGLVAPVHRCACAVCGGLCAVSRAWLLLFTGVRARCVALRVRCPGPCGCCSPVCLPCVWCCVCGVPGLVAPVHRCACVVCCKSFTAGQKQSAW